MKQITCSQMGGTCDAVITGNTPEELAQNGMKHVEEAHPDQAAKIKAMSAEETGKWMEDLKGRFGSLQEA